MQKLSQPTANSVRISTIQPANPTNLLNSPKSPKPQKSRKKYVKRPKPLKDKQNNLQIEPVLTPKRKKEGRLFSPQNSQNNCIISRDKLMQFKDGIDDIQHYQTQYSRQGRNINITTTTVTNNKSDNSKSFNFAEHLRNNSLKGKQQPISSQRQQYNIKNQQQLQQQCEQQEQQQFESVKKFSSKPKWINYFNTLYSHNSDRVDESTLGNIQIQNQNMNCKKIVVNLHSQRSSQKTLSLNKRAKSPIKNTHANLNNQDNIIKSNNINEDIQFLADQYLQPYNNDQDQCTDLRIDSYQSVQHDNQQQTLLNNNEDPNTSTFNKEHYHNYYTLQLKSQSQLNDNKKTIEHKEDALYNKNQNATNNNSTLNHQRQSLHKSSSSKCIPNEYLLENIPTPNDNYQDNDYDQIIQYKLQDAVDNYQMGTTILQDNNFVTFQQQLQAIAIENQLPTGISMFEAPLSTSSHKSHTSSCMMHEEQPLLENIPLPAQRPQLLDQTPSLLLLNKHTKSSGNNIISDSSTSKNQSQNNSQIMSNQSIQQVDKKQNKDIYLQIAKKVTQGFKVRQILKGKRLRTLINKIRQLYRELNQAKIDQQNFSNTTANNNINTNHHDVQDSLIIKQLDMQLRRKKELFIDTFNEILRVSHWYRASKMSDNIRERKREIIMSRLRLQSLNSNNVSQSGLNNKSLLENSFLKDEIEAVYPDYYSINRKYSSNNTNQINSQKIQQHTQVQENLNDSSIFQTPQKLNKNMSEDNLNNQILFKKQKTQQLFTRKQYQNSNDNNMVDQTPPKKVKQSNKLHQDNRVKFRESIEHSFSNNKKGQNNDNLTHIMNPHSYKNQEQLIQQSLQDNKTEQKQQNTNVNIQEQSTNNNIEKIVISFQEIYEQEMQKFKKIKFERSSSRDKGLGLKRDVSYESNMSLERSIQEGKINQSYQMKDSFSLLKNNYLKNEDIPITLNTKDNQQSITTINSDQIIVKSQQAFQHKSQSQGVKINFHKKSSSKQQNLLDKIGHLVQPPKTAEVNLDSDNTTNTIISSNQNSTISLMSNNNLGDKQQSLKNSQISSSKIQNIQHKQGSISKGIINENNSQQYHQSQDQQQQYFNKLRGKYTKIQSKIDCWHPNNTPVKSPPRSNNINLNNQSNVSISCIKNGNGHDTPIQLKLKQPPASSMGINSSTITTANNITNKKAYLKTVQVKECILITPSTQASYSETLESNSNSKSSIQLTTKNQKCTPNNITQNFSQRSALKSPLKTPSTITSRQQASQHKLKSSRSQENFYETSQLNNMQVNNNIIGTQSKSKGKINNNNSNNNTNTNNNKGKIVSASSRVNIEIQLNK